MCGLTIRVTIIQDRVRVIIKIKSDLQYKIYNTLYACVCIISPRPRLTFADIALNDDDFGERHCTKIRVGVIGLSVRPSLHTVT